MQHAALATGIILAMQQAALAECIIFKYLHPLTGTFHVAKS
jgi:hypothetical protein